VIFRLDRHGHMPGDDLTASRLSESARRDAIVYVA
jgi:hypothetical protein